MNTTVRTRFAPSPTGDLHIGGARTALFAYLWAKKNKGQFILRVEDTDTARTVEGSESSLKEGLAWLGMTPEEGPDAGGPHGPYRQSERLELYTDHANILLENGNAYRCFCTPERLQEMRTAQQKAKQPPRYDRACHKLSAEEVSKKVEEGELHVVRLLVPATEKIIVNDLVRGELSFNGKDIDDQVLLKSDGFPTYHLANIVDDHLMEITHVIRGEEWLPSTPKHVLLYQAFGWAPPVFVHLSLFLSKGGGKMSKRDGETSLLQFRDNGYLPEAVINFSALLGWNPKTEEEFFTLEQLIERFDLAAINPANAIFDTDKLDWTNQHYMREFPTDDIVRRISELVAISSGAHIELYKRFIEWFTGLSKQKQDSIMTGATQRSKTLSELAEVVDLATGDIPEYDAAQLIWKKSDAPATLEVLNALHAKLSELPESEFTVATMEQPFLDWISAHETWGNGDVLWPMRFALSGQEKSPSPFEMAELLGKEQVMQRIELAQKQIQTI